MTRIFDQSQLDKCHRLITCSVHENNNDCIALFTCIFEGTSIKSFHVDSFRPSAINVGMEYQIFINRSFRMVREGMSPDEASILEI